MIIRIKPEHFSDVANFVRTLNRNIKNCKLIIDLQLIDYINSINIGIIISIIKLGCIVELLNVNNLHYGVLKLTGIYKLENLIIKREIIDE